MIAAGLTTLLLEQFSKQQDRLTLDTIPFLLDLGCCMCLLWSSLDSEGGLSPKNPPWLRCRTFLATSTDPLEDLESLEDDKVQDEVRDPETWLLPCC